MGKRDDRLSVFFAEFIGDFSQFHMVTDMIFKFPPRFIGNGVHDEMVMQIVRIQVGRYKNFIVTSLHDPCGGHTDFMCFFRCDLSRFKALVSVIGDIAS